MTENNNDIKFQFTRHALSCNNVELGSSYIDWNKKDFEPSITDHALMQLTKEPSGNYLRHNNSDVISNDDDDKLDEFNFERFKQNTDDNQLYILVSPLIRTWETAVVLYGIGNPEWKTMNLYIGPHLKEFTVANTANQITTGNFYEAPETIIPKFKNFLQILLNKEHDSMKGSQGKKIILHWPQFKFFDIKNTNFVKFTFIINSTTVDISPECKSNMIGITLGTLGKLGNYYVDNKNLVNDIKGCFKLNGNLQKFMKMFNDKYKDENDENGYPKKLIINNIVHIVTHSNVMQDYIKQIHDFDMKKQIPHELPDATDDFNNEMKKIYLIRNSNNWTFKVKYEEKNDKKIYDETIYDHLNDTGKKNFIEELIKNLDMQLGVPNEEIKTGNKIGKKGKIVDEKIKDFVKNTYNNDNESRKLCGLKEKIDKKMTCNGEVDKNINIVTNKFRSNQVRDEPQNGENTTPSGGKRKSRKYKKSKKNKRKSNTRKNKKH